MSGISNDYEWVDGQLQFINIMPADTSAEYRQASEVFIGVGHRKGGNTRHAVSNDGSRVFWSTASPDQVYMRDVPSGESIRISKAEAGVTEPTGGNSAEFQFANSNGSEVFFTDENQLTDVPGSGLYVYDVETGKLTLLTIAKSAGEEDYLEGMVLGGSEDGSYIYYVDTGVLSGNENARGESAEAGDNNLYVTHSELQVGCPMEDVVHRQSLEGRQARLVTRRSH